MKSTIIEIDNLKCGGCEHTVNKAVESFEGVESVQTSSEEGTVRFSYEDEEVIERIKNKLSSLGYPPAGSSSTLQKAVSFVSCAKGRITK